MIVKGKIKRYFKLSESARLFWLIIEEQRILCYNFFMVSIKINDVNKFMHDILVQDFFDSFLVSEVEICTSSTFNMNGRINKNFYNSDELENIHEDFISWKHLKHICFEIIRGKKVPSRMKLVLASPKAGFEKIMNDCGLTMSKEDIGGLYMHVLYEDDEISIITGTSLNIFTMDKTLDKYWDHITTDFLSHHFDISIQE